MIQYRKLNIDELVPELFAHFIRRQVVTRCWRKEAGRTVRDQGALIFFILVPLFYPLLYAFIYTEETVREVPAVVVDDANTAMSRGIAILIPIRTQRLC